VNKGLQSIFPLKNNFTSPRQLTYVPYHSLTVVSSFNERQTINQLSNMYLPIDTREAESHLVARATCYDRYSRFVVVSFLTAGQPTNLSIQKVLHLSPLRLVSIWPLDSRRSADLHWTHLPLHDHVSIPYYSPRQIIC
jgi:hypothetical protein